jgi:hypothetical protein
VEIPLRFPQVRVSLTTERQQVLAQRLLGTLQLKLQDLQQYSGVGYFCDTTSAGFTVTLPATPSAGDIVGLVDYAGTFDTNALTIDPNGEDIEGGTNSLQLKGEREGVVLVYVDSTQGWLPISGINEGTDALEPVTYSIDFLVIAGGGGGGGAYGNGGGGGAGGYRTSTQTVTVGTVITVTVGDGGASVTGNLSGINGSNSSISGSGLTTITSAGGGAGGGAGSNGSNGGSGGGGAYNGTGVSSGKTLQAQHLVKEIMEVQVMEVHQLMVQVEVVVLVQLVKMVLLQKVEMVVQVQLLQ